MDCFTKNKDTAEQVKIIDPHLHLFDLNIGKYEWLKSDSAPFWPDKEHINRSFSEHDLTLDAPLSFSGFVHIEAGFDNDQPWQEIKWLESTCQLPFRSIAYIDITLPHVNFLISLKKLQSFSSLVGVRYIFEDIDLVNTLSIPPILDNLKQLEKNNLIFELHITLENMPAVSQLCHILNHTPKLHVIINHAGFPKENNDTEPWESALSLLSQYEKVSLKCSGWEMTNRHYSGEWVLHIIKKSIQYFSEDRIMLASNFPLVLFTSSYNSYWQKIFTLLSYNKSLRDKLLYENSYNFYRFDEI